MSDWYVSVNTHRCFIMSMVYILILVDLHLKYYTDLHDVDEELMSISAQSGRWEEGKWTGVTFRIIGNTLTGYADYVAYKDKNSTPVTESRVLYRLFKFVDMSNYEGTTCYCVYRTLKC